MFTWHLLKSLKKYFWLLTQKFDRTRKAEQRVAHGRMNEVFMWISISGCWKPVLHIRSTPHYAHSQTTAHLKAIHHAHDTAKAHYSFVGQVWDSSCRQMWCHLGANKTPDMETLLKTRQVTEFQERWASLTGTHYSPSHRLSTPPSPHTHWLLSSRNNLSVPPFPSRLPLSLSLYFPFYSHLLLPLYMYSSLFLSSPIISSLCFFSSTIFPSSLSFTSSELYF